jgi:hypothetical protein
MNKFAKIIEEMDALNQKILLGDNEKMKKLAANGIILPPPPKNQLISIIFFLQYDENKEIAETAKEKFVKLPENMIVEALNGPMHQYVIAGCYRYLTKQEDQNLEIFKAIIKHQNFNFNFIEKQLKDLSADLKSYLADALSFIAPYPKIMSFLVESEISKAQKQKILDFAERNDIKLDLKTADGLKSLSGENVVKEDAKDVLCIKIDNEENYNDEDYDDENDDEVHDDDYDEEIKLTNEELGISEERSAKYNDLGKEADKVLDERKSLARLINEMNIAEKIKLAMKGNMEARGLLIKHSNRLVVEGVVRNPMITEQEIVKFSLDKNIHRDAIKYIANNKVWLRKYIIKMNVVLNPKTPTGRAVKLLATLRHSDIKKISKEKGVTSVLRRAAMEIIERAEKKKNKK